MTGRLLVIGAGGLGGPLACAAAEAGLALVVVDPDVVELSNLQRQIQFTTDDLGRAKVDALGDELARRGHPRDRYRGVRARFDAQAGPALLAALGAGPRVLVEASDDLATKFLASDLAVAQELPAVIGGVLQDRGQVLAFAPGEACYRCLFEAPPDEAPTCGDVGVLGAAVAVIAGAMARAALALLAGSRGHGLAVWDTVSRQTAPRQVRYNQRVDCPACRALGRETTE